MTHQLKRLIYYFRLAVLGKPAGANRELGKMPGFRTNPQLHIAIERQSPQRRSVWAMAYNLSDISLLNDRPSRSNTDYRHFAKLWTFGTIMTQYLIITLLCWTACKPDKTNTIKFDEFSNELRRESLVSKSEGEWLLAHPYKGYSRDTILNYLKEAFVQDIPLEMRPMVKANSTEIRGLFDRSLSFPSPNGALFLRFDDSEVDSLLRENKLLVDFLAEYRIVTQSERNQLNQVIDSKAIVLKYDLIDAISKLE